MAEGTASVTDAPEDRVGYPEAGRVDSHGAATPGRRWSAAVGWAVAVVALALAAVATVQWFQTSARLDREDAAATTAGRAFAALTNWQAGDLDAVRDVVADLGTDRFQDEAGAVIDELAGSLSAAEARSTGEVLDLAATLTDEGPDGQPGAVAVGVVRQVISNAGLDVPDTACWGARAVLVELPDGWLVDQLELYGPNACPEETP